MHRQLNFYDFLLWSIALLLLTLTVPVLPGLFHFAGPRKLSVGIAFLVGAAALWTACSRPLFLQDHPTDRIDLYDWLLVASGLFFGVATWRNFVRWFEAGMTPHKSVIVAVLGIITVFAFYCILDRGGIQKFASLCFFVGALILIPGFWKLGTGSISPMYFNVSERKETGYVYLSVAALFIVLGLFAHVIQRRIQRRG